MKARKWTKKLTDGSEVFGVTLTEGDQEMTIPCISEKDAEKLLESLDFHAVIDVGLIDATREQRIPLEHWAWPLPEAQDICPKCKTPMRDCHGALYCPNCGYPED